MQLKKQSWRKRRMMFLFSCCIFIIKGFRTIVFIFIVISITFRPICPPVFFKCLSNLGTFTELQTTSFIESTGIPEFDKHLKKAGGHIGRNVVEKTIKMKTIVWKPLMIKITKLCLRNLDNLLYFFFFFFFFFFKRKNNDKDLFFNLALISLKICVYILLVS